MAIMSVGWPTGKSSQVDPLSLKIEPAVKIITICACLCCKQRWRNGHVLYSCLAFNWFVVFFPPLKRFFFNPERKSKRLSNRRLRVIEPCVTFGKDSCEEWTFRLNKNLQMSLPLGASPRVTRDYRQFEQSPLSQPFQGGSAAAMAQAGKKF